MAIGGSRSSQQSRLVAEVHRVKSAALRRGRDPFRLEVHGPWETEGHAEFLYKANDVLVDDVDLPRVRRLLDEWHVGFRVADALIGGVTLLDILERDIIALLDDVDRELGVGVMTPNHVLDVQGGTKGLCPATEPEPATLAERWPQVGDPSTGAGVRVAVVDTGFIPGYESDPQLPWLGGVQRFDPDDEVYLRGARLRRNRIAPYGGHGTFSAGVVLSVAPGVSVSVDDVLTGGVVDEATIVRQLIDAIADSPDIISVSAGTYTRKNVPPKALRAFYEHRLRHHKGVALVAAAGNNGDRAPFWPAAFPWALSVGALSRGGDRRMPWSNHGGWVDVYAPGEDLVNAFPNGVYDYLEDHRPDATFRDRMARWSGTSFSTPLVAGLVARRMSQTGESGREAARALRRLAQQQFLPGVGPRLLP